MDGWMDGACMNGRCMDGGSGCGCHVGVGEGPTEGGMEK